MPTNKNRVQAFIGDDLLKALKSQASQKNLSLSGLIELILKESVQSPAAVSCSLDEIESVIRKVIQPLFDQGASPIEVSKSDSPIEVSKSDSLKVQVNAGDLVRLVNSPIETTGEVIERTETTALVHWQGTSRNAAQNRDLSELELAKVSKSDSPIEVSKSDSLSLEDLYLNKKDGYLIAYRFCAEWLHNARPELPLYYGYDEDGRKCLACKFPVGERAALEYLRSRFNVLIFDEASKNIPDIVFQKLYGIVLVKDKKVVAVWDGKKYQEDPRRLKVYRAVPSTASRKKAETAAQLDQGECRYADLFQILKNMGYPFMFNGRKTTDLEKQWREANLDQM